MEYLLKKNKIQIMSTKKVYNVEKIGIFTPKSIPKEYLKCGEVGWIVCGIRNISGAPVGDTITQYKNSAQKPLPGFKKIKPKIYAGLFTTQSNKFSLFKDALGKLSLNDSSLFYEPEHSLALGFGFRCGFLGLLHMEIIQARLEREYNLEIISTSPTVIYEILTLNNTNYYLDSPFKLSKFQKIKEIREPIAKCLILLPIRYLGNILSLCAKKRGIQNNISYYNNQILLNYSIPMSEVILNFFDQLKSVSSGYASLEYNFESYKKSDVKCLEIFVNYKRIDALSTIIHQTKILSQAKAIIEKMKYLISRHQFDIVIQAVVEKKVITKTTIKQLRKNVLAKCYGGDITRKKKKKKKNNKKK